MNLFIVLHQLSSSLSAGLNMPLPVVRKKLTDLEKQKHMKFDGSLKTKTEIIRDRVKKQKEIARHNSRLKSKQKHEKKQKSERNRGRKSNGKLGVKTSDFHAVVLPMSQRKRPDKKYLEGDW